MSVRAITPEVAHPALVKHAEVRAQSLQNRVADLITTFAGSMMFVYLHVVLFVVWMLFVEKKPWPTLTLAVSLEAIFLSTFVMISQNRADEKRQILASQEWTFVKEEERQNEDLLKLSDQILTLTKVIHDLTLVHTKGTDGGAGAGGPSAG